MFLHLQISKFISTQSLAYPVQDTDIMIFPIKVFHLWAAFIARPPGIPLFIWASALFGWAYNHYWDPAGCRKSPRLSGSDHPLLLCVNFFIR